MKGIYRASSYFVSTLIPYTIPEIHNKGHKINGTDKVAPNMVKYCWNPSKIHMYQGGTSSTEYIRSLPVDLVFLSLMPVSSL